MKICLIAVSFFLVFSVKVFAEEEILTPAELAVKLEIKESSDDCGCAKRRVAFYKSKNVLDKIQLKGNAVPLGQSRIEIMSAKGFPAALLRFEIEADGGPYGVWKEAVPPTIYNSEHIFLVFKVSLWIPESMLLIYLDKVRGAETFEIEGFIDPVMRIMDMRDKRFKPVEDLKKGALTTHVEVSIKATKINGIEVEKQ